MMPATSQAWRSNEQSQYPNAGFPLPGHVLTMRDYGPGLEIWREKDMDGNDW